MKFYLPNLPVPVYKFYDKFFWHDLNLVKLKSDSSPFDLSTRFDSPLNYGQKMACRLWNWGSTFYISVLYHLHRVRTVKFKKLISIWDPKKLRFFIYFWSTVQQHHTFQDVLHKYITFYNSISCSSIIDTKRESS